MKAGPYAMHNPFSLRSLIFVTLLVCLLCTALPGFAQAAAVQQDNATLDTLRSVSSLRDVHWRPVNFASFAREQAREGLIVLWGGISPNGSRIIAGLRQPNTLAYQQFGTIDLTTLTFTMMPPPDGIENHTDMICLNPGAWDKQEPDVLYVDLERGHTNTSTVQATLSQIWRVRYDGSHAKLISNPNEDTSADSSTPDGRWLLVWIYRRAKDNPLAVTSTERYYLSTNDPTQHKPLDWPEAFGDGSALFSPNGNLLERTSDVLTCCDLTSKRVAPIFSVAQLKLQVPTLTDKEGGQLPRIEGLGWLPDSSGFLADVTTGVNSHELWQVGTDGQARRLSTQLEYLSNSLDGHYYLFRIDERYYLVTVPKHTRGRG